MGTDPFGRYTEDARKALDFARTEAERLDHNWIGTEHMILGLLRVDDGLAAKALHNMGITIGVVRPLVESVIGKAKATTDEPIVITARMQKLIGISFSEAQRMGENWIGTEHLLLGLLVEREGIAAQVLRELGVTADAVRSEVRRL
jgi:ATP-dependent Clp protease ATP-binding subunit ClpC